jgi:hypothetical protein
LHRPSRGDDRRAFEAHADGDQCNHQESLKDDQSDLHAMVSLLDSTSQRIARIPFTLTMKGWQLWPAREEL